VSRGELRRQLGDAAVYSVAEAVALIGGNEARTRRWLRDAGLVRETPVGRRVFWDEVRRALATRPVEPPPKSSLKRAGLSRSS
jgi:hypothetical protein